jgi:hypothetical protein
MDVVGSVRNKLSALLGGGKSDSLFAARQEYNRAAIEAQEMGTPLPPFEQWMQARKARPNALMSPKPMADDTYQHPVR